MHEGVCEELKNQYENNNVRYVKWHEWYYANKPLYKINVPNGWKKSINKKQLNVHLQEESLEDYWNSIRPKGCKRVDWTYKTNNHLLCNGLTIQNQHNSYRLQRYRFPEYLRLPSVSIIDNDANLPLNLDRNGISDKILPFEAELIKDIYNDIVAKLLLSVNISELCDNQLLIKDNSLIHPAISGDYLLFTLKPSDLLLTKNGFNILHKYNLEKLSNKLINKMWVSNKVEAIEDSELFSKIDLLVVSKEGLTSIQHFKTCIDPNYEINLGQGYNVCNLRAFIKKENYNYIFEKDKNRMRVGFKNYINIEDESNRWYCITYGSVPNTLLRVQDFERNSGDINLYVEYYFTEVISGNNYYYESNFFEDAMTKYIGENVYIPYDINTRKDIYEVAFKELERYMKKYYVNSRAKQ